VTPKAIKDPIKRNETKSSFVPKETCKRDLNKRPVKETRKMRPVHE